MSTINILHLSDLHLSFNDEVDFDSFLSSIEEVIIDKIKSNIHMIMITGDLVNKGTTKDLNNVFEKFINKIAQTAKCKVDNVFCVPGNHDTERDDYISELREKYKKNNQKGTCWKLDNKDSHKVFSRFEDFCDFNSILHPNNQNIKSFGVYFRVIGNKNIAITCINSAIYANDDNDYKNLGISKKQLDILTKQYQQINESNNIDLNIALMHHPADWLRNDEQEKMWQYFSSKDKLPVDIILHGHTHEGKIGGKIDLDTFILSLVTGTTYEDGNKEISSNNYSKCRLAFYKINTIEKTINGKLFYRNDSSTFVSDLTTYRSLNNEGVFEIFYNKDILKSNSICKLPIPVDNQKYINSKYICTLNDMIQRIWNFEKACRRQLDAFRYVPKVENELDKKDILKDYFLCIASCAKNSFFPDDLDNVRFHFREYNGTEHIHFCATVGERKITPIKWNNQQNLIFHAFDKKRSLVKSLNPKIYFETNGEWQDFLTIPIFYENYNGQEIPTYSFGISVKGDQIEKLTSKLEILSFLRIECLIDSIISSFHHYFLL